MNEDGKLKCMGFYNHNQVNDWLKNNHVEIIQILQTESAGQIMGDYDNLIPEYNLIITIFYKDKIGKLFNE